jgi:hypothetical protein
MIWSILSGLIGLVNLVLAILVLIKLFQKQGVLHGILGIICMIYTFIWGWIHAKELDITNIMIGWSACIVVQMILGAIISATSAAQF